MKPIAVHLVDGIRDCAQRYPWWGYKRIAVVCRREPLTVSNRQVYQVMKRYDLLQKRRIRQARVYQAMKLFELLPSKVTMNCGRRM